MYSGTSTSVCTVGPLLVCVQSTGVCTFVAFLTCVVASPSLSLQFHPEVGETLMKAFLSYYRCSVMYLSVSMVNEFGYTPMTPHVRLCIPGTVY